MQRSKDDKHWQIERMNDIYKKCEICFVLPGGIRRLVSLKDETSWISRVWTLQEVMVPKRAKVLFAWNYGSIVASRGTSGFSGLDTLTPYQCSMATIGNIFHLSLGGTTITTSCGAELNLKACIFGNSNNPVLALMGAMDHGEEMRAQAIWSCALMRTSSRPVDMVFSIMGLFGVTLDTSSFGSQDRQGATIALATKILEKGGKASWLGPSFFLPPDLTLSAFPTFPRSTVAGGAYIRIGNEDKPVEEVITDSTRWLDGLPKGSMSSARKFTFKARGAHLIPAAFNRTAMDPEFANETIDQCFIGSQMYLTAMDGSVWQVDTTGGDISAGEHFVIFLGTLQQYGMGSNYEVLNAMRALLVEVEGLGTSHRKSYFVLGKELERMIKYWNNRTFTLGSATVVESARAITRTNIQCVQATGRWNPTVAMTF